VRTITSRCQVKGDRVIVRGLHGEPAVKVIWEETATGVELCTEEKTSECESPPPTVGYPKEDVFRYSQDLFERLKVAYKTQSSSSNSPELEKLWSAAELYFEEATDNKDATKS